MLGGNAKREIRIEELTKPRRGADKCRESEMAVICVFRVSLRFSSPPVLCHNSQRKGRAMRDRQRFRLEKAGMICVLVNIGLEKTGSMSRCTKFEERVFDEGRKSSQWMRFLLGMK